VALCRTQKEKFRASPLSKTYDLCFFLFKSIAINSIIPMSKHLASNAIQSLNTRLGRHQPLILVLASIASTYLFLKFHRFWCKSERSLWSRFKSYAFQWLRKLPSVRRQIEKEMQGNVVAIMHSIHDCDKERDFIKTIPTSGLNCDAIVARAEKYDQMNEKYDYSRGRVSGSVYTDIRDDHVEVLLKVGAWGSVVE
jgi:hypothetical protein